MKKILIKYTTPLLLAAGLVVGCADLDTENLNRGDIERVLGNTDDYAGLVSSQFNVLWHTTQHFNSGPSFNMGTVADANTSSWGNFGMRDLSSEPRIPIENSETYTYRVFYEQPWEDLYAVIGAVNDIIKILKDDASATVMVGGEDHTGKVLATAYYLQGVAYGNLALNYDKGRFINEETTQEELADIPSIPYSTYSELAVLAVAALDKAAAEIGGGRDASDWNMDYYNGVFLSKAEFTQLIRSFQASILAYAPRTEAENGSVDWNSVLSHANAGLTSDFVVIGDGGSWWDAYKYYGSEPIWARIDYRIIAEMVDDPTKLTNGSQDAYNGRRFPENETFPYDPLTQADVIDARLGFGDPGVDEDNPDNEKDFKYLAWIPFRANRGYYHYSHYQANRYFDHFPSAVGPMPHFLAAENDLLKAEAMLMTGGNSAAVAALINNTRVGRGQMTPLDGTESTAVALDALFHERYVELAISRGGIPFYNRRKRGTTSADFSADGLQQGAYRQMPVPAKELNTLGEEIYTFPSGN